MNKIKFFCVLASVILLLSFVGCSHSNSESSSVNDTTQTKEENKEINEEIIEITGLRERLFMRTQVQMQILAELMCIWKSWKKKIVRLHFLLLH